MDNINKQGKIKTILSLTIGIVFMLFLVIESAYAYFTMNTTNNFDTRTITAETPVPGSAALTSANNMSMNLSLQQMMDIGEDKAYYAQSGSNQNATDVETTVKVGEITVVGNGTYSCNYSLEVRKTPSTNSMYEAFQSMSDKSSGQIMLTINVGGGSTTLDFNTANLFPKTISGKLNGVTEDIEKDVTAQLKVMNKTGVDQGPLAGTNITISIVPLSFSCEAEEEDSDNYTLGFNANGGYVSETSREVTLGDTYGTLPTPVRDGYTFMGWNGKNKFFGGWENGGISVNDGSNSNYGSECLRTDYILLEPNKTYYITLENDKYYYPVMYDSDKNFVEYLGMRDRSFNFTTTNGEHYIRIMQYLRVANQDNVQLEEGNTATAYEPYYLLSTTEITQEKDHTLTAIWEKNS